MAPAARARPASIEKARTLVEALEVSFRDALRTPDGTAEPVALLWTDPKRQWEPLVERLRALLSQLFTLGDYTPAARTGPAIWLRCVVDRTVPEAPSASDPVPVLYLPGLGVQELRDAANCPAPARPLVDLMLRGSAWSQRGGRDWTPEAFLGSKDGLGFDIAQDALTREALTRVLPLLAEVPLDALRTGRLEAADFDRLAVTDAKRELLRWMDDEPAFRAEGDDARWRSFCAVSRTEFRYDPEKRTPADAATAMVEGGGAWDAVWARFRESPRLYAGVAELLRSIAIPLLAQGSERNPRANKGAEERLRDALHVAASLTQASAIERVTALEEEHGARREWAWAELGESPLAIALEPLVRLANCARTPMGGGTLEAAIERYTSEGWKCDRAAMDALCAAPGAEVTAIVGGAVRAIYGPWLDESARHFQGQMAKDEAAARAKTSGAAHTEGECVLFADGLRFDMAAVLRERLDARGMRTRLASRLAPLPTVTATAKPVAAGLTNSLAGADDAEDFTPRVVETKQAATAQRLRDLLSTQQVDLLGDETRGAAFGTKAGWVETGQLDHRGHQLGAELALHLERELEQLVARIGGLLDAGWRLVRVVTDHGWLLLPGGLPRVDLPTYLTATKWARCATVRGASQPTQPIFTWHWNPHVRIASPPGIACFIAGNEYAHGGVSPQECIVPELIVERGAVSGRVKIESVSWRGMRCRVRVAGGDATMRVDLRVKERGASIAASAKAIGTDGEASLAVADDSQEGQAAMVVVLDASGAVLDRRLVTVGETT